MLIFKSKIMGKFKQLKKSSVRVILLRWHNAVGGQSCDGGKNGIQSVTIF